VTSPDAPAPGPQVGERFIGAVVKTAIFGAYISLPAGGTGLLHITEIRKLYGGRPIKNIDDVIRVGDQLQVEIFNIDERGKVALKPAGPQ
jgi:polyribonucleotide nucleotidyltransferase